MVELFADTLVCYRARTRPRVESLAGLALESKTGCPHRLDRTIMGSD